MQEEEQMNITQYIKGLLYEYRLQKHKEILLEMKHNLKILKRGM